MKVENPLQSNIGLPKILKIRLLLRPPKVLNLQAEDLAEGLIFRNEASKILKNFFYENLFLKKIHTLWVFQTSVYLWNFLEEGWKIKGRNTFYLIKHLSNLYQIDVSFLSFNQHGFDVQWERICYVFFHEPHRFALKKIFLSQTKSFWSQTKNFVPG